MEVYELLKDYRTRVAVLWSYIIMLSALLLETVFRTYISSLLRLAVDGDYGYVVIGLALSAYIVYLSITNIGISHSISVGRILVSTPLFSLSLLFLTLARINQEYVVQLEGLSFALFLIGLLTLMYNARRVKEVLPLFGLLVLVPIPNELADYITLTLSRYLGRAVACLTRTYFTEEPSYSVVEIMTPLGIQRLTVEIVCNGMLVVGSILPAIPLLLYITGFSTARPRRKLLTVLASLILSFLVGLVGNIFRIALAIIVSQYYGVEAGLRCLHYVPSIACPLLSIAIVTKATGKMLKSLRFTLSISLNKAYFSFSSAGAILIIMGFATFLYYTSFIGFVAPAIPMTNVLRLETSSTELLENPTTYILRNATLLSLDRDPWLAHILGAPVVHNVSFSFNGALVRGYIEVVDTPARLRSWRRCLMLQGYKVTGTWGELVGGRRVNYVLANKNNTRYILTYFVAPISTPDTSMNIAIYARVSLLTPVGEDLRHAVEVTKRALLSITSSAEGSTILNYVPFITAISMFTLILIFLGFITAFSVFLYKVLSESLRNIIRRG